MLPSLLMDINNMITVRLLDKPIYFLINVDHNLPNSLVGDDIRIKQVLMNLLGNSVKFTKEGFIELHVAGKQVDKDNLASSLPGHRQRHRHQKRRFQQAFRDLLPGGHHQEPRRHGIRVWAWPSARASRS